MTWNGTYASRSNPSTIASARRVLHLRNCDRTVRRDHVARLHDHQLVVEREDLAPVGVRCAARRCAPRRSPPGSDTDRAGCAAGTRTSYWPSSISARSHSVRSWSGSSTRSPLASVRAARRESVSKTDAEQPDHLGLVGHQVGEQPRQPDCLGAEVRPYERPARARGVALVVDEVENGEDGLEAIRQLEPFGHTVGDVRVADLALRPTRRCAIVASGTRKARAISSVCSPPSRRNVSATCTLGATRGGST